MLSNAKTTLPEHPATQSPEPDRLANAFFYANELSVSRLLEKTKADVIRWPAKRRAAQSARARAQKLWKFSTGPVTDAGKYRSSMNAYKHGCHSAVAKELQAVLMKHRSWLKEVEARGPPGYEMNGS